MGGNPEIPQFAPSAPPSSSCNTDNNGLNIIQPPPSDVGKDTEVLGGFAIISNDLSDIDTDRFLIDSDPYEFVTVALSIVMKASTVPKTNPILKGTTIDAVECDWTYNAARDGDISVQTLVNTGAGVDPTLIGTDRDHDYSGLTITGDQTVTVEGTDGISTSNEVEDILFGNYLAIGLSDPSMLFRATTEEQAIFDALSDKRIRRSQANESFNASGTSTEYMVIAHPESWGESEFTKGSFTGGYQRIYKVNRGGPIIFVNEVLGGDTELDIEIDNGNGHTENYYFYQSEFPERSGNEPTVITKA